MTFECASIAAGSVLQVVDTVLNGNARSGVCIVRPPGHHAESDLPHGFCFFNNAGIAASYAIRDHGMRRVLIVDWDVHHGNGTQHMFESSPNVLFISVHRYDHGNFFPKKVDADYTVVGEGRGEGFNVNIPWNKVNTFLFIEIEFLIKKNWFFTTTQKGMGDMEYALAFQQIIMPIAYEFDPELVIVSAGFDAAIGDPLGGCKVSPEAFGWFTQWLSALAGGRIILCLEGGYNVNSVSYAMTMCTKALLGDPLPALQLGGGVGNKQLSASCIETIQNVLSVQQKYWKSLRFNKKLPADEIVLTPVVADEVALLSTAMKELTTTAADQQHADGNNSANFAADGNQQPGCSSGGAGAASKSTTLDNFLEQQREALRNEEYFAVYPLPDCPHLAELAARPTPAGK